MTIAGLTNRITTLEHGERAQRVERMSNNGESLMPFFQSLVNRRGQSLFAQFETMSACPDECARPARLLQTECQIVDALRHAPDPGFRNNEPAASDLRGKKVSQ